MKVDVAPTFSDEDLALRFADKHGGNLRYVSDVGWYSWDGKKWQRNKKLLEFNYARQICRAAAKECNDSDNRLRAIASAKTVAAVERLARRTNVLLHCSINGTRTLGH